MSHSIRRYAPGETFFFTVGTGRQRPLVLARRMGTVDVGIGQE